MRRQRPSRARGAIALLAAASVAACGSGESILDAGNEAPPPPSAPVTTLAGATTSAPDGSPPPDGSPAPTITDPPPTTATTPLDDLPGCPTGALVEGGGSGPVEVVFWHGMTGVLEEALAGLTDEYNATQSAVRVRLENQGGYEQTLDKYVQSSAGSRPALVQLPEYTLKLIVDSGTVVPTGACLESSGFDTTAFVPRMLAAYATEGVQWGMPFNVSAPVLFYNRTMFEAAGLDPDDPPISLDEVRAASEAIVSSGVAAYGIALDSGFDSGGGWFVEQWLAKIGLPYADNDNGRTAPATRVLYSDPRAVDLFTEVQSLIADGLAVDVGDNASGQDNFLKLADQSTPAAMTIGSSAALGTVLSVVDQGLIPGITGEDIGIGPMPGPDGVPGVQVGGAALYVVAGQPDATAAAAWDYVTYLTSAESQSRWAAATGYVPVRDDAVTLEPLASTYVDDPRFAVAYGELSTEVSGPVALGPVLGPLREVRVVTSRAVAEIFDGADVASALAGSAAQSDRLIADYLVRNS